MDTIVMITRHRVVVEKLRVGEQSTFKLRGEVESAMALVSRSCRKQGPDV